jgi:hypothetical protein
MRLASLKMPVSNTASFCVKMLGMKVQLSRLMLPAPKYF